MWKSSQNSWQGGRVADFTSEDRIIEWRMRSAPTPKCPRSRRPTLAVSSSNACAIIAQRLRRRWLTFAEAFQGIPKYSDEFRVTRWQSQEISFK